MQSFRFINGVNCVCCTAKEDTCNAPIDENAVQKLAYTHPLTCAIEVDHNENKPCVTNVHAGNAHTESADIFDDDCPSQLITHSVEASSEDCLPVNYTPSSVYTCHMNDGSVDLSETRSDTVISQKNISNAFEERNSRYHNNVLCDSYCDTDSDVVSQSQGPQLTNTQKVQIFALELDMMKVPTSAHSSQNSLFDSLTDMSVMLM